MQGHGGGTGWATASVDVVADTLARLRAAVDDLQALDLDDLDADAVALLLLEGRRQIERAEATWSQAIDRYDARAWWKGEARSMKAWLRARCRMAPGTAAVRLRSARRLRDLPLVTEAYLAGDVSTAQVSTITRAVTDERVEAARAAEGVFVDAARHLDATELGKVVAHWRALVDPDGTRDDHDAAADARRLSVSPVGEGTALDGWLGGEGGEGVRQALATEMARLRGKDDPRRPEQLRADALASICAQYLQQTGLPRRRGLLYGVNVTVSWETLTGRANDPGWLEHGGTVPAETARRLACDADVARILTGPRCEPLDVGRRCRTVTPAIWKALVVRDGGCVSPGCDAPLAWLHAHHLIHWADGGPTSLDNMVLVCGTHHHDQHEGGHTLASDIATRRWVVHTPDGHRIVAGPTARDYIPHLHATAGSDPPARDHSYGIASDTRGRYEPGRPAPPPDRRSAARRTSDPRREGHLSCRASGRASWGSLATRARS
jgi:hypothetical protein